MTYTIDELSTLTRTPSRTIRFYQSRGALAKPTLKGRVAYYGAEHVERLRLIAQLQDRGLSIDAIRDVVTRIDVGRLDVGEWLGLQDELSAPWTDDSPRSVDAAELAKVLGERPPGLLHELVTSGAVIRDSVRGFYVRSPKLLSILLRLYDAGIRPSVALDAETIIRSHLRDAAKALTRTFVHALELRSETRDALPLGDTLAVLKSASHESVTLIFQQEIERALQSYVTSGATKRGRRARRR